MRSMAILRSVARSSMDSSSTGRISVAVAGVGLVGSEFVSQLRAFPAPSPFQIVSLSSSKTTLFNPDGLDFDGADTDWKSRLASPFTKFEFPVLIRELSSLIRPGNEVVFVDNTSSDEIANTYPDFLRFGVHVITPNKKAFSADLSLYERILAASFESGARFFNEATVGAGLPVVSTLKDLVATGDTVRVVTMKMD
jgi:homoserine dehydrogenase